MCEYGGQEVKQGDTVMENCNECRCEASSSSPGCMEVSAELIGGRHGDNTVQVLCSTTQCVLDPATVRGLGAGLGAGLGWRPLTSPNTSSLWGHSLGEAATGLLGTGEPGAMVLAPVQV